MMRIMQRLSRTALGMVLLLYPALIGCTRSPYATPYGNPYGSPYGGSPWTAPAPGTAPPVTLPPPQSTPGAAFPSVPALPPATGAPGYGGSAYANPALPPNNGVALPDWSNPGTMAQQQQRANTFDPYADNDAAPAIVGGRPRDFQKPLAEPVRQRGFRDTRWPF